MSADYTQRVSEVTALLQGKWTSQILCAMRHKPVRLSQLRRTVPQASKKALTTSLRTLEAAKIIVRKDLSSSVLHVEYDFEESMRLPMISLLDYLSEWGQLRASPEKAGKNGSQPEPK